MKTKIAALVLFACLFIGLAQGQPGSIVDRHPIRINNTDHGYSQDTDIAIDGDGNFTVVWEFFTSDPAVENGGIWARRFAASGVPLGPQFNVAAVTVGPPSGIPPFVYVTPQSPAIAMTPAGNFVVAWMVQASNDPDEEVVFRRYNAAGAPLGAAVTVGTGDIELPQVVMDSSGNFLVAWYEYEYESGASSFHARLYNADGTPRRPSFLVKRAIEPTAIWQPSVAMGPEGNFVVAWEKTVDYGSGAVRGRRFDADGNQVGPEFIVAPKNARTLRLWSVRVAMDESSNFVVAYVRRNAEGSASLGIFARRFNADGTALAEEFTVSKKGNSYELNVDMNAAGDFALAWQANDTAQPVSGWPHTRLYAADGSPVTAERSLPFASPAGYGPLATAVAMDADGDYVFAWAQGVVDVLAHRVAGPQDMQPACSIYLATEVGTNSADTITGTTGDDVIQARDGIDWVDGGGGGDVLCGGGDGDQLYGSGGADQLFGGKGDDVLDGGLGTDICDGREHDNTDTALACETVIDVP